MQCLLYTGVLSHVPQPEKKNCLSRSCGLDYAITHVQSSYLLSKNGLYLILTRDLTAKYLFEFVLVVAELHLGPII